jgi:hypothetical protein
MRGRDHARDIHQRRGAGDGLRRARSGCRVHAAGAPRGRTSGDPGFFGDGNDWARTPCQSVSVRHGHVAVEVVRVTAARSLESASRGARAGSSEGCGPALLVNLASHRRNRLCDVDLGRLADLHDHAARVDEVACRGLEVEYSAQVDSVRDRRMCGGEVKNLLDRRDAHCSESGRGESFSFAQAGTPRRSPVNSGTRMRVSPCARTSTCLTRTCRSRPSSTAPTARRSATRGQRNPPKAAETPRAATGRKSLCRADSPGRPNPALRAATQSARTE